MIQILHYYCKPRKADILNNVTYHCGISCQIQTEYLDISDIVKELTNKNHVDCIAIDEDLFGTMEDAEDIVSKIELLKFVCGSPQILILALERTSDDEIIHAIRQKGIADYIITKEMIGDFENILTQYFDGNLKSNKELNIEPTNDVIEPVSKETIATKETVKTTKHDEELTDKAQDTIDSTSPSSNIVSKEENKTNVFDDEIDLDSGNMITVGICGLQPHIGVTHHSLAMAKALSDMLHKKVCYKEQNEHNIYPILQLSSLAEGKQGYICIAGVDVFDKNSDIDPNRYALCIIDFGYIRECSETEFFNTDIPVIIAGAKDWEIQNFVGAYQTGTLDKASVIMNFFPQKEQSDFKRAFPNLNIWFSDYAPEVFEADSNALIYNEIIKKYLITEV